jgi:hypothetical protein
MPWRRVVRKDLQGREVGESLRCYVHAAIAAEPGLLTVEQCVMVLLAEGESAQGDGDVRPIEHHGRMVGCIQILDAEPIEAAGPRAEPAPRRTGTSRQDE